ncbi:MAG: hypothetical protein V4467_01800 [Patescibacteria group bacterium]
MKKFEFAEVLSFDTQRGFGFAETQDRERIYINDERCHVVEGGSGGIYFAGPRPDAPPVAGDWIVFERTKHQPKADQNWTAYFWGPWDQYRQAYLCLEQNRPATFRVVAYDHWNNDEHTDGPAYVVAQGTLLELIRRFPRREDENDPCGQVYVRRVGSLRISCFNEWQIESSGSGGICWKKYPQDPRPMPAEETHDDVAQAMADETLVKFPLQDDGELAALAAATGGKNTKAEKVAAVNAASYGDNRQRQGERRHFRPNRF